MTKFDIYCANITYQAQALMSHAQDWRNAKSMSLGEVDLVRAERHLKASLEDVRQLLVLLREGRKESA